MQVFSQTNPMQMPRFKAFGSEGPPTYGVLQLVQYKKEVEGIVHMQWLKCLSLL